MGDVRLHEELGIGYYGGHNQPILMRIGIGKAIERFFDCSVRTIRNAILSQIPRTHMVGENLEITGDHPAHLSGHNLGEISGIPYWPATAVSLIIGFVSLPQGYRISLPVSRDIRRCGTAEMQEASLGPRIGVDSQRVVVLPINVQPARNLHDRGGTVTLDRK